MTVSAALLAEFEEEMSLTRKILECVPQDNFDWKPHEKSFTLGRLANHIARLPISPTVIISGRGSKAPDVSSKAELLATFDGNVAASREALAGIDDEGLARTIRVTPEISKTIYTALRGRGLMNHLIHHRGQMTVYLRLLGVPIPGLYGPSADEKSAA
jgi:uncharacterized damage-inducible protein DinB